MIELNHQDHAIAVTGGLCVRYPFEPLAQQSRAATIEVIAERVGVSRRTVHRWALNGVPAAQADRAAIAIGSHPAYVWPDHWNQTPH